MANVQNVVAVPVTPQQPKNVPNQQLFVYINKDVTGGRYFFGNAITGTSTVPTAYDTDIAEAIVGDLYVNDYGQMYICTQGGNDTNAFWKYSGISISGNKLYFGWYITGTSTTPTVFASSGVTSANSGDVFMNTDVLADRGNLYQCVTPGDAATATWAYIGNVSIIGHDTFDDNDVDTIAEPYQQKTFKTATNQIKINLPLSSIMYNGYISEVDFVTGDHPVLTVAANGNTVKYMKYNEIFDTYTPMPNCEVNMMFRYNGNTMLCVIVEIPVA